MRVGDVGFARGSWLAVGLGCVLTLALASSCDDGRRLRPGGTGATGGAGGTNENGAPAWQWTVACPDGHEPASPIEYGDCALEQALAALTPPLPSPAVIVARALDAGALDVPPNVAALVDARPESYAIVPGADQTLIVGRDATGVMYGELELAERLRLHGPAILSSSTIVRGAPAMGIRAANLFWTVKSPDEATWWFLDEGFWHQYLDLMASARLNLLDLHAMYDPASTVFPNALLYLARSASFPDVGVPVAERDANLAMFNKVVALAAARGIRVGLMTYRAGSSLDGQSAEKLDDESLKTYDREAAADVATRIPGLAVLGFRIGESGQLAPWFIDSIVAGAHQARPELPLYTRTWGSGKDEILKLAAAFGEGTILEAKYNGEQLGPPYVIAGGNFIHYGSYSYQNYLTPPAPWAFVFQVRTAGTHRFFRAASYERARRAVLSLGQLSPSVRGFTLEPPHAYNEQRDVFHASAADRPSPWTFVRDDLMYLLWGRLGYDPTTPESTFRALAARELGTDALWDAIQAADDIVPWIQTGHTCGPDHRDFNPEMELGGDVAQWAGLKPVDTEICAKQGPFDTFAIASPQDAAADLVANQAGSRISPIDIAAHVLDDVAAVDAALQAFAASSAGGAGTAALPKGVLARDLVRECRALADLGRYFAHKLRGATALAVYDKTAAPEWLSLARGETTLADDAWRTLADDMAYVKPFAERLRMGRLGYDPFHWSKLVPALDDDAKALDEVAARVGGATATDPSAVADAQVWLRSTRKPGPGLTALTISPALASAASWSVEVRFAAPVATDATVNVLWKRFDSEKDWVSTPASRRADGSYGAAVAGDGEGALFAVEVRTTDGAWRYPDAMTTTPYVSVAPGDAPP